MKKILLLFGLMAITTLGTLADTPQMKNLFVAMPDSVMPYLSRNSRLDFIDFMDSKMKAEVTNELGGKSMMTALADDSISITMNETCSVDLLLLNIKEPVDSCSKVIALVRTLHIEGDMVESEVEFYSTKWVRLDGHPPLATDDERRLSNHVRMSNILKKISEKINK